MWVTLKFGSSPGCQSKALMLETASQSISSAVMGRPSTGLVVDILLISCRLHASCSSYCSLN